MNGFYLWFRRTLLHFLRVPPEPHPPAGSPGSLRVFRAGINQYRLQRALWILRQVAVVIGLGVGFLVIHGLLSGGPVIFAVIPAPRWWVTHHSDLERWHVYGWFLLAKTVGILLTVAGALYTYTVMRLGYEMHWYMVTDRSLRIREGVTRVREMTLSFANIQQITVRQGPLQRLLGLADVVITTAGGGATTGRPHQAGALQEPCHVGVLRSIDDAGAVRDLMLERLRLLKSSGLGDPDDSQDDLSAHPDEKGPSGDRKEPVKATDGDVLEAAHEVLAAVRALRDSVDPKAGG